MRRENGYTGVDIAISVIVITMFITIIGTIIANFKSNSSEMEYKSKALDYAINRIEEIKSSDIADISNESEQEIVEDSKGTGFYEKIEVIDASSEDIISEDDLGDRARINGLVKKVTVTISYNFKNETKNVQLSAIVSNKF